jgi:phosphatidate cytidylyltransferase
VKAKVDLFGDLKKRVFSSIAIGAVFIISIFFSKLLFVSSLFIVAYFMLDEWYSITNSSMLDLAIGLFTITISIACTILIRLTAPSIIVFLYFAIMWSTDTFAMVGGKLIGGYKLAPKISPNKTWSGLLTGVLTTGLLAGVIDYTVDLAQYEGLFNIYNPSMFAISIAVLCQLSDLFVSIFKRKHNIKDSGNVIPGHGGVLDRFDSMILSSPIIFLLFAYY